MIVLDASAAVDLLIDVEPHAARIEDRLGRPGETLHTPYLFDAEVLQGLRGHALRGVLSRARAREALEDLAALKITRYPYLSLLERMWVLRENLTAFDAAYVALAETLGAPLVTTDARLARAGGHRARVELYP